MSQPEMWKNAGTEPRIDDLIDDPMVHLIMVRDGIGPWDVTQAIHQARQQLAAESSRQSAALRAALQARLAGAWQQVA